MKQVAARPQATKRPAGAGKDQSREVGVQLQLGRLGSGKPQENTAEGTTSPKKTGQIRRDAWRA